MEGKQLKIRRKNVNLTQVELAEMFGVSSNTVARWENGVLDIPKMVELALRSVEAEKTKDAPETVKPPDVPAVPVAPEPKTLLSIESAAVKMKCKESKISAMIRDGRLPSVKVGGRRMVDEKDLK